MSDMPPNGNGHPSKDADAKPAVMALRNFRIEPGQNCFVRILSPSYCGLFTHYYHKRSVYCPGRECTCPLHKLDRIWKGYCAIEVNKPGTKLWRPECLEITEALELDFRHVFARGQVWEIFRDMKTDHKQPPYQGKLFATRDPSKWPAAFNILPVIQALYHRHDLDITQKSPVPDRVYITTSEDEGVVIGSLSDKPTKGTYEEWARIQEEYQKKAAAEKKSPTDREKARR